MNLSLRPSVKGLIPFFHLKRTFLAISILLFNLLLLNNVFSQTQTFTSNGNFVVPAGVTSVTVEAWGGGGAGGGVAGQIFNTRNGGGGSGGTYTKVTNISVTPGQSIAVTVGAGGTGVTSGDGNNGGTSVFASSTPVVAIGGNGGRAGNSSDATGAGGARANGITYDGGAGGNSASGNSGGGGGGAGSNGDGGAASGRIGGSGGNGGGGDGADGRTSAGDGSPASTLAGGGSGGRSTSFNATNRRGGNGFRGQIIVSYTQPTYKSQLVSMDLGSSTWCRGETRNVTVRIRNIGTATWSDGTAGSPEINIGVKWNQSGSNWTDYYIRTSAGNLAPGQTGTYVLPLTASNNTGSGYTTPLSTGSNNIIFDVVYEMVSWFGDNNNGVGPGNTRFVSPNQTIVNGATANAGNSQTICQGGTTSNLGGSVGGSATGGMWSDGGIGGTFSPNANTLSNVTYRPPVSFSGTATLTLTTSGGTCGTSTASKTITVNALPTSNAGSDFEICQGGITDVLGGTVGGSATGGTWTSSAGGSFSPNANNLNARWTPPAGYTGDAILTLTTTGGSPCASDVATKIVKVRPAAIVNAGASLSSICQGGNTATLGGSIGGSSATATWTDGGIGGSFSNAGDVNSTWTPPANYSGTATLTLTADAGVCGSPSDSKTQVVNGAPTNITASPAASTICFGSDQALSGSATATGISTRVVENFNGTISFGVTGSSEGDRSQVWQKEANGTNVNNVATFTSPNTGSMMVSTASSSNIFFGTSSVNSILTSPAINTSEFSGISNLSFNHTYRHGATGSGLVQISVNNGANWTTLRTYSSSQGGSGNFTSENISLASYANAASIMLRFNFTTSNLNIFSTSTSWWAVDDIAIDGVRLPLYSWTADTDPSVSGLPAGAGIASTSNANISVNPAATTTYTLTATNASTSCSGSSTQVIVTVNPKPTLAPIADVTLNTSSDGSGECSAAYNWTHPSVNTNCSTTLNVTYTAGFVAPAALPANGTVTPGDATSVSFSTGVTIVTYTATDANNNTATASFKVTVTDDELPVITCPEEIVVNNTLDQCSATVILIAPVTSDNCGVASVTNDHPSDVFTVGTTDVIWTVMDINNNIQTCIQKVTVIDNQAPTITCNPDVNVNNDLGECGAVVNLSAPSTNDNCGIASVVNDHSSSNIFPVGVTIVKWTVTDNAGNISTCEQTITVTDNEKPKITCPASLTTVTDAAVDYATIVLEQPIVTDNCGVLSIGNNYSSTQFPIGTTLVTWTAIDVNGNSSTCIQTIVVNDTIQPFIAFNPPINLNNLPGLCLGAIDVTYPEANDNSGHVTVTSNYGGLATASIDPVSPLLVNGVQFPVGQTTIVWTATDPSSNKTSSTQTIEVVDNEKPTIECAGDINQQNDPGVCSAIINLVTPVTSDNCGVLSVTNDHPSNVFSVGETFVKWTVTDIHGNSNTCTQKVTVTDTELPSIVCDPEVNVNNDQGQCGASVTLTSPVTNDNCGVASVSNDHPSNVYPVGVTVVTWTVVDIHGNSNTCAQQVTVTDNEVPVIIAATDIHVNNDAGQCGAAVVIQAATATDNCGVGATTGTRDDGHSLTDAYPTGTTTITWTVTDIHGNAAAEVTQTVTVTDTELPVITASADMNVMNDAGKCSALVMITSATATDNCGVGNPVGTRSDHLALDAPYSVGLTTISWNVTDDHGNKALTVVQKITVTDNELPVITTDTDIIRTADAGICGALVTIGIATAADNCGVGAVMGKRSDHQNLNAVYPVGLTTITWTVTDIHGNEAIAKTQTVTVTDNELPVITASSDINVTNDAGQCGAIVYIETATATDNCGVGATTGTRSDGLLLTDAYPVGTTTITWTATDIHGNAAEVVTQTITVTDNELPIITASADKNVFNDAGQCGAIVGIEAATATDNCGVGVTTGTRSDGLLLTEAYPVGTTTITWSVTDIHGNAAVAVMQEVNVNDNELPVITHSGDISVNNDEGQCGATITIVPATATDNCQAGAPIGTRSDGEALSNVYPVGTTTITWTVSDIHGNVAIAQTQTITVSDNELPVINAGEDITQTSDAGQCGAIVAINAATATDNCGVGATTGSRSDGLSLTDAYPVGTTTITWAVTDIHGNTAEIVTQTVTVTDDEKPVIIATPSDRSVNNDAGICGAVVSWSIPTATDNCSVLSLTSDHHSGDVFPVGTTIVTYTATDIHQNVHTSSFTITVLDNEKPTIVAPSNITLSACTPTATWSVPITGDNCSVASVVQTAGPASGSEFANGTTTTISYRVNDMAGNFNDASFTVTRIDSISIAGSNSTPVIYYGSPIDQTSTIKVIPTGGVAPYTVSISMDRPILCDVITGEGDEKWTSTGTNTNNTCGTNTQKPVSTWNGVISGTAVSVNVSFITTGKITATVTDANGCVKTYTTTVYAEDVRCFAGKSGNAKVKICHQTNKGCNEICVDASAVKAHLAHGDFLGSCTPNCVAPAPVITSKNRNINNSKGNGDSTAMAIHNQPFTMQQYDKLEVKVMPNPTSHFFTFEMHSASKENIKIRISDITGRLMEEKTGIQANSSLQIGSSYRPGLYIAEIFQGKDVVRLKIIKGED